METKTDPAMLVVMLGIFMVLIVGVVYMMMNDAAEQRQDAIDRCVEETGGGNLMRVYCTQVYNEQD